MNQNVLISRICCRDRDRARIRDRIRARSSCLVDGEGDYFA